MGGISSERAKQIALRVDFCNNTIAAYDAKTATTEQQQIYAGCVNFLHPTSGPPSDSSVDRAVIGVSLLIAILSAAIVRGLSVDEVWQDRLFVSLVAFFVAPFLAIAVAGLLWLLYSAIHFVLFG